MPMASCGWIRPRSTAASWASGGSRRVSSALSDHPRPPLGTLGGTETWGYAMNGSGQVSWPWSHHWKCFASFVYRGTPGIDASMSDFGTLGGVEAVAYAINEEWLEQL